MTRTGRRPGAPATRAAIVDGARRAFATRGYDATSLRSIAAEAGVDPALLIHYFGTKDGLFAAAIGFPVNPSEWFADLPVDDLAAASEELVRRYLELVDSDDSRNAIVALVRSAVSNEQAAAMLRQFVSTGLLGVVGSLTRHRDAERRASLAAAQLVGVAMLRHVVGIGALADAPREDLVRLIAPVVELYLR